MAALTHAMETRLDSVREGSASVTPELVEALLKALDVLRLLRDEVETRVAADVDVDAAAASLERRAALRKLAAASQPPIVRLTITLEAGSWAGVPSQADIEREDFMVGTRLVVLVSSDEPLAVLLEALKAVPELAAVEAGVAPPADASPSPAPSSGSPSLRTSATTIRIDVGRLDTLLNLVGELVIDRTRLARLSSALIEQFGDDRALELIVEGKDTELDRSVIEEIGDPLLHLIRNAVDHGIETPAQRTALGKPAALAPGGVLFLGATEAIMRPQSLGLSVIGPGFYRKAVEGR
jgi:two-component system chemotaxis sensor kinase CheA